MLSKPYTISVIDRCTGIVRSVTVTPRLVLAVVLSAMTLPVLMGLGARWSSTREIAQLRGANAALRQENDSYRAATGQLTTQIASLQGVVSELGRRTSMDPETAQAIERLPAVVRNRAIGGVPHGPDATRALLAAMASPESTFGVLRDLLGNLERRLRLVGTDLDRWDALAHATPSIWPAVGWITDRFGQRVDPFTGGPDLHLGLDIAGDKGDPVYATADGVVESAGWAGDFGNLVVVDHGFGLSSRYGHMSAFAVRTGEQVKRGDVLGYIGATGRASGPHLHYEVWANGRPMNPLQLLSSRSDQ